NSAVTLSALDRLIDDDPETSVEAAPTRSQSVRQMKEAVRRDLEWLLNTRRVAVAPEEVLKEVNRSVYIFGLPDFTAYSLNSSKDQVKLMRHLQTTVKLFEPRLANVRIIPLEDSTPGTRTLRFRIEGLLQMDPAPEHISFDTVLELTSGEYEVGNAR
ncbi:MAG TPA: type VI secretion system baseplate subunit TssE, partial [Bryobacteraceae bacterium]|nr:type VI secretion system baseplate subunit TssE [Bryobacteraceae bacterium]